MGALPSTRLAVAVDYLPTSW